MHGSTRILHREPHSSKKALQTAIAAESRRKRRMADRQLAGRYGPLWTLPTRMRFKWYTDKLRTVLDCGVDCFKTDFGERIPVDVVYHDGSDPQAMHNYYTYLYNQAVFSLLKEVKGENEAVLFARSATAGSQKIPGTLGRRLLCKLSVMAETLRGGLSFAMSGFSFWSHDISGFESTATPDLYKRWCAFGLMSTHSRLPRIHKLPCAVAVRRRVLRRSKILHQPEMLADAVHFPEICRGHTRKEPR